MENDIRGNAGQVALSWLAHLKVGDGLFFDRVVVFPAFAGNGDDSEALDYRTLGEAIAAGWVEVTERAAASVPELVLRNRGRTMVLVLDGEEIVALGQDVRLQGDGVVGAALVYRETSVHTSLFRTRDAGSRSARATGMARVSVRRGFRYGL